MSADAVARLDAAHNRLRSRVVDEQIELDERERMVSIPADDLRLLLDRVVYLGRWMPDTLEDLDAGLLEVVARCLRAAGIV